MQANYEESSILQGSLTLSYTESSKRLQKDQHKTWLKFWCGKNTCKATTWYMQFLRSYCIHKLLDLGLYWKFKKVTQRSTSNLAEMLMRTSLPVKLQHDADTFWGIIFTRNCKMLPFEHDLVQKVRQRLTSNSSEILWRISLSNYETILAIPAELSCSQGLELGWKFIKVTQRSMSNSSEIFM